MSLLTAATPAMAQEKAAMCAGCHGVQGISSNPDWPNLAGQHAPYLEKQMHDYKNATLRHAAIMTPLVSALSDEDIHDLADFYAHLSALKDTPLATDSTRGETLYRRGDLKKHITACIACHGPTGAGNAQAGFPLLIGQQPGYTVQQLQAFKDKSRQNDLHSIMRDISSHMSTDDMEAVAHYLAGSHK